MTSSRNSVISCGSGGECRRSVAWVPAPGGDGSGDAGRWVGAAAVGRGGVDEGGAEEAGGVADAGGDAGGGVGEGAVVGGDSGGTAVPAGSVGCSFGSESIGA